jgi:CARDB
MRDRQRWIVIAALTAIPAAVGAQPPSRRPPTPIRGGISRPAAPLVRGSDLVFSALGLGPTGQLTYTVMNHGETAITVPFVVDVYIDDARVDTYKHASLAGGASVTVSDPVATVSSCAAARLKVIADPQHVVTESSETDNTRTAQVTPPCPDLVVTSIKQDWEDFNTRYRIQVTVKNQGNLAMPKAVVARAWGAPGLDLATLLDGSALPILSDVDVPILAPGQSKSFHVGGKYLGTDHVGVKVYLDFFRAIQEQRTDNNLATKEFGPH